MKLPCRGCALLWIVLVFTSTGCVQVAPWERGTLAKPQMALELYPSQTAMREHTYGSREAATGGSSSGGGGCGCY